MGKQIHFYTYDPRKDSEIFLFYYSWNETEKAISKNERYIYTTQMGLLSTELFERGYKIFIHESPSDMYLVKLGTENKRTNREIKMGHNLFKMWKAGEFAK